LFAWYVFLNYFLFFTEIARVGGQVEVLTFTGGHTIPIDAVERAAQFLAAL